MALSCEDLLRRLDEGAPLDDAEALRHLEGCARCRAAAARAEAVSGKLREWAQAGAPPFLHGRVMAHVRASGRARASWLRRFWWAPTLATGALVAIVIARTPGTPLPEAAGPSAGAEVAPRLPSPAVAARPASAAPPTRSATPSETDPGALRGGEAAPPAAVAIACELLGPDTARSAHRVMLDARWAPPRGVSWAVVVAASGEVRPAAVGSDGADASPAIVAAVSEVPIEALEQLANLGLAPGRYVLQRTP